MVLDMARARGRYQLGQRLSGNAGEGKIDYVRVAEQVVEEWLDALRRIRPSQLEQNYAQFQSISQCFKASPT
jgi:hypothetical protein